MIQEVSVDAPKQVLVRFGNAQTSADNHTSDANKHVVKVRWPSVIRDAACVGLSFAVCAAIGFGLVFFARTNLRPAQVYEALFFAAQLVSIILCLIVSPPMPQLSGAEQGDKGLKAPVLLAGFLFISNCAVGTVWLDFPGDWRSVVVLLAAAFLSALIAVQFAVWCMRRSWLRPLFRRAVAVYGTTQHSDQVCSALTASPDCEFAGLFDQRAGARVPEECRDLMSGSLSDLQQQIQLGNVDEVVVLLPDMGHARTQEVLLQISNYSINVWLCMHLPRGSRVIDHVASPVCVADMTLVQVHRRAIADWSFIFKSLFDRVLAFIFLLLLSPMLALIAIAIKLDSAGPVFFRQSRHGVNGSQFKIWKFRSMTYVEKQEAVEQARRSDPRITRVGRFIRQTSLDELPQLINILLGEMSFVGPRPHAVEHNRYYERLIAHYAARNMVKPGLTGWAQINGCRGETPQAEMMAARIRYDQWYILNWSFWLDFKILIMTPYYGLFSKNAY